MKNSFRLWQACAEHIVLVDGQIVFVTRIDLHESDASTLELELLDALDHDFRIFAVAAVPHVRERIGAFPSARFGVGAAHGEDAASVRRSPASQRRKRAHAIPSGR